MLKDFALGMLDRWDYSNIAIVLGVVMLGIALFLGTRATGEEWRRVCTRGVLWALVGAVAGAVLVAGAACAANLLLLHIGGGDHASHFHPALVRESAKVGGALGCGVCALIGTVRASRSLSPEGCRPGLEGE